MKKVILSLAIAMIASLGAKAQAKFGIGLDGQLPIGNFGDFHNFGFGGSLKVNYTIDPMLDLTGSAGYISFGGKNNISNADIIPVLAGIEVKFGQSMVYGSAQLGAGFGTKSGSKTAFTYAPGIGYKFSPNLDLLAKYTGYSAKGGTNNTIGLRLGYTFGQSK